MNLTSDPQFCSRTIWGWLKKAEIGYLALPSFQRSYVWKSRETIEDYLLAVFNNRPTGVFLILETNGKPQLSSRSLRGIDVDVSNAEELLLDGQQRLTSLWQVLNGRTENTTYYAQVNDLSSRDMSVRSIFSVSNRSILGKSLSDPKIAYAKNLVPMAILPDRTDQDSLGDIWSWSKAAVTEPDDMVRLRDAIRPLGKELLCERSLHYWALGPDTDRRTAIDIFIQSNKSSVRVNEFDIAVAMALDEGELELRDRIASFHEKSSETKYYIGLRQDDDERAISTLGEWALFSACISLHKTAPKKARYKDVVPKVFGQGNPNPTLDNLLQDEEAALRELAKHGAPIRQFLPTVPALHVVAGLQRALRELKKANQLNIATKLLTAYLCRSFFSDRYEARANDLLYEDYVGLLECIEAIKSTGKIDKNLLPIIFNDENYPVADEEMLGSLAEPAPWIGGGARLGKALAAIQLAEDPFDWVVGTKLNTVKVRELHRSGSLDRHHVFPRKILKGLFDKKTEQQKINHGLNGVVLCKPTNQGLSRKDPTDYLKWILDQPHGPSEQELRRRVESHLVPYDAIMNQGNMLDRYEAFISQRATLIADKIKQKCQL